MEFSEIHELEEIYSQSLRKGFLGDPTTAPYVQRQQQKDNYYTAKPSMAPTSAALPYSQSAAGATQSSSSSSRSKKQQQEQQLPIQLGDILSSTGNGGALPEESLNEILDEINSICIADKLNYEQKEAQLAATASSMTEGLSLPVTTESKNESVGDQKSKKFENESSQEEKDEEDSDEDDDDDSEEDYDEFEDGDEDEDDDLYDNGHKFEGLSEAQVQQSFQEVVMRNVSLLRSKQASNENEDFSKKISYSNSKAKKVEVYFFCTPYNVKIGVDNDTTVAELTKNLIEIFMADSKSDKSLMKHPKYPQAYELRIRDDDSYKPEPNFPPLDASRLFQSMQVDSIVFMNDESFKPPVRNIEDQVQEKVQKIFSAKGVVLSIQIVDAGISTMVQFQANVTIREVLEFLIAKKNYKINMKEIMVSCLDPSDDKYQDVDFMTPVGQLLSQKLKIRKKEWADKTNRIQKSSVIEVASCPRQVIISEPISNMNLVKYEEFTVIKINDKGKKQFRILGIDQHKVSNINRQIQAQSIGFLDRIFADPVTGTKNPSRNIEHIQSVVEQDNNIVVMKVKDPEVGYEKNLKYYIENADDRKRLVKKLEGLMDLQKRDNMKSQNYMTYQGNARMSYK